MNNIIIRKATIEDAKSMVELIKKVSDETDFLTSDSSERNISVEKEIEYLQNVSRSKTDVMFICEVNKKAVGTSSLSTIDKKRIKHRAQLGISVLKEYWNMGLGSKLMRYTINYAQKSELKKIELEVRIDNLSAIELYKKYGFEIEGNIRNYFFINGKYYNCYVMGLILE